MERACFAAGCFWGVEAKLAALKGVLSTQVGYTGGQLPNPDYSAVCSGRTGHAEAVVVEFDPQQLSYQELLSQFWLLQDPTQKDRQGPDIGSQYRSAVFYYSEQQRLAAEASKAELAQSGRYSRPIVTEITAATEFYPAEDYHQQYLAKRGRYQCH